MTAPKPLWPAHRSMHGKKRPPANMERAKGISADQYETVQAVTLSIFTDMSNAGFPLRDALASIYLTGMQHAMAIIKADHE